ncbi:MAG: lamin tail domain-containing protein [bacterium]
MSKFFLGLVLIVTLATPPLVRAAVFLDVVISEICWMGDNDSYRNEWIKLYNNSSSSIDLTGWQVAGDDLTGEIPGQGSCFGK